MKPEEMRVVVTGGAGFIGSHTVEALLDSKAKVSVFDDFSSGSLQNLPNGDADLTIIQGDIRSQDDCARAMEGATHVLHLAAQVSVVASVERPSHSCERNVLGFVNVLDAARRAGVRRVVYASSAAVYGAPTSLPLTEASVLAPISPYGLEKYIDEQYAQLFSNLYGMQTLGLRYFNVYGPRQDPRSPYAGVIAKFGAAIGGRRELTVFGDGMQTRDFVFVKDIARINRLALCGDRQGICNVGTGRSVTLLDLICALEGVAKYNSERRFVPANAGDIRHSAMSTERLLAWFGEVPATTLSVGLAELLRTQNLELENGQRA